MNKTIIKTCCHSDSSEKISGRTDAKNFKNNNNNDNFEMETGHPIKDGWPDLVLINQKKNKTKGQLLITLDYRDKNRKWKDWKIRGLCLRTKRLWNMTVRVILVVVGAFGMVPNRNEKGIRTGGDEKKSRLDYISQNTEKSPWDLRRYCNSDSRGSSPANDCVKNSQIMDTQYPLLKVLYESNEKVKILANQL